VPPGVPTLPVSTLRKKSARATCQPPRLPMLALRQVCVASRAVALRDVLGRLADALDRHLRLLRRPLERELAVERLQQPLKVLEGRRPAWRSPRSASRFQLPAAR
jgi:hypothetical protein